MLGTMAEIPPLTPTPEKLKLRPDCSHYGYLNREKSVLPGMDDAANFRAMQVRGHDPPPTPQAPHGCPHPFPSPPGCHGDHWLHTRRGDGAAGGDGRGAQTGQRGAEQLLPGQRDGGVQHCRATGYGGAGGIGWAPPRSLHSSPSSALSRTELQEISQLVGLDPSTLEQALCSRTVKVRDESVLTALSVSQVSRVPPLPPPLGLAPRDPREPPSPLPRATTAVMRWPRTSTAVCSTGWWTASTPASG